jgi:hypothetical protein
MSLSPTFNLKTFFGLDRIFADRVRVPPVVASRLRTLQYFVNTSAIAARQAKFALYGSEYDLSYEELDRCADTLDEASDVLTKILREGDPEFYDFCNFDENLDD